MKIRLSELRLLIREAILEIGGAAPRPPRPVTRNPMSPSMSDRQQIGKISIKQADAEEEITPHLRDPMYDEEDIRGPVPPSGKDPYALPDFYVKDYGVIPTPPIKR